MNKSQKYLNGISLRKEVLGADYVNRAERVKTDLDARFQELITESAWGSVWASKVLSKRERSLITLALLASLGQDNELILHVKACQNTGASDEEIIEAMMHVAIYCGVPKANHAIKLIKKTLAEIEGSDG